MAGNEQEPFSRVLDRQFLLARLVPGMTVLDIGCGDGNLMADISSRGCFVTGVEINGALIRSCLAAGLRVSEGRAEELPIPDASIDAIVCNLVLPYTDENRAVAEWARVLKGGEIVNATCHGVGYG